MTSEVSLDLLATVFEDEIIEATNEVFLLLFLEATLNVN